MGAAEIMNDAKFNVPRTDIDHLDNVRYHLAMVSHYVDQLADEKLADDLHTEIGFFYEKLQDAIDALGGEES